MIKINCVICNETKILKKQKFSQIKHDYFHYFCTCCGLIYTIHPPNLSKLCIRKTFSNYWYVIDWEILNDKTTCKIILDWAPFKVYDINPLSFSISEKDFLKKIVRIKILL